MKTLDLNRTFCDTLGLYQWDLILFSDKQGNPVFEKRYVHLFY